MFAVSRRCLFTFLVLLHCSIFYFVVGSETIDKDSIIQNEMNEVFPCEGQDVNIEEGNDAIQALTRKCIGDKCYTIQCIGRLRCQILTEGNNKVGGTDAINFPFPPLETSESTLEGQTFGLFKKFLPDITIVKNFPPSYPSVMTTPQQLFVATPVYPQNIYTPPFLVQPAAQPIAEIPYRPATPPQVYFFPTPIPMTTTTTAAPVAQSPIVLPSPLVIAAPVQTTTVAPTARQGGTMITFGSGTDPTIVISTGDASTTTTSTTTTAAPTNP